VRDPTDGRATPRQPHHVEIGALAKGLDGFGWSRPVGALVIARVLEGSSGGFAIPGIVLALAEWRGDRSRES
jgi:hypothetical protein